MIPDPANLAPAYRAALAEIIAEATRNYYSLPNLHSAVHWTRRHAAWRKVQTDIAWSIAFDVAHGRTVNPADGVAWLACYRRASAIVAQEHRKRAAKVAI